MLRPEAKSIDARMSWDVSMVVNHQQIPAMHENFAALRRMMDISVVSMIAGQIGRLPVLRARNVSKVAVYASTFAFCGSKL